MKATPRVVVLGGGFAGLETTFYLRHKLGDHVNLTLISDQDYCL
jgi:sulfide:quinone oxidoreductase